jgi:hypothetical protein
MPDSLVLSLVLASMTSSACPPILQNATRLMLVTAPTMSAVAGELRLFERDKPQLPWRLAHAAEPAVLGLKGMGWGGGFEGFARSGEPIKSEGDDRTPAGMFPAGRPFGFESSGPPGYLQIRPTARLRRERRSAARRMPSRCAASLSTGGVSSSTIPRIASGDQARASSSMCGDRNSRARPAVSPCLSRALPPCNSGPSPAP